MTKMGCPTINWGIESAYKDEHRLLIDHNIDVVVQIDNTNITQIEHPRQSSGSF